MEKRFIKFPHKMKFFLDENMPSSVADIIKKLGFEVEHARICGLRGASDKQIAEHARKHQAILVTKDLEFGSSILYPKDSHYGLLVLRLPYKWTSEKVIKTLKEFLTKTDLQKLINSITILEIGRYRTRKIA